ncbi:hypothetical protein L209DRAFT_752577 [Thermothelomyces heterothallicus CBS 203.75]
MQKLSTNQKTHKATPPILPVECTPSESFRGMTFPRGGGSPLDIEERTGSRILL